MGRSEIRSSVGLGAKDEFSSSDFFFYGGWGGGVHFIPGHSSVTTVALVSKRKTLLILQKHQNQACTKRVRLRVFRMLKMDIIVQ